MSEAVFKLIEWENYIQQTPVTDNATLLQVIAAYEEGLNSRVYDSGDFASHLAPRQDEGAGRGEGSQECSPHEPLQDGPAAGGDYKWFSACNVID